MYLDRRLLGLAQTSKIHLGATITLGFASGVLTIIQAHFLSRIIAQAFLEGQSLPRVMGDMTWLLILLILRSGLIWAGEVFAKHLSTRTKAELRHRLLHHIQILGPVYASGERSGELTHLVTEGIEALDAYFSQYLPQLVLAILVPMSFLIFVFPMDALSGVVMLLTAPLIPLFMWLIGSMSNQWTRKQWGALSQMSAHLLDVFQGLTTLKIFGRSRDQVQVIASISERHRKATLEVLRITFLSALALEMIATISTAVVAVEVGLRLLYGRLEFEQAFFVLLIAPEFYLPLRMLGMRFHAAISGIEAAKRIFSILETLPQGSSSTLESHTRVPIANLKSTLRPPFQIVFEQVGFTYPDGRQALHAVSFEIRNGQKTALVGPSGAGKSTLAYLLLRFLAPTQGRITVNGEPLDKIPLEEWRKRVAWIPQSPYIFNDTVAANIRLGCSEADLEVVIQAAQLANAHEFIERLPQGYATVLGERGVRLSAGEAQRIALARAFLSNAPLILLDEPTANLDPETEESLRQAQERLFNGRTTIIIAHRLTTVRDADQIIVLANGRVAQMGTHASLLQQEGLYQRMIRHYTEGIPQKTSPYPTASQRSSTMEESLSKHVTTSEDTSQSTSSKDSIVFIRLLSLLKSFPREIALSILLGFATILSSIGLMTTSAYIISLAALHPSIATLQVAITGVRTFGITRGVFRYLERLVSHNVTFHLLSKVRIWFYQVLEPLAPARLLSTHSGDLLSRAIADIAALENFYVRAVAPPLVALLIGISAGVFLASFHPRLLFTLLIFYLIASIGVPFLIRLLARLPSQCESTSRAALYQATVEGIQGISDLLVYGAQHRYMENIKCITIVFHRAQQALASIGGLQNALVFLATHLCAWMALWLAIPMVDMKMLNGIYLAVIVTAILTSFEAVLPLGQAAYYLESSLKAARRLFELTASSPEVQNAKTPLSLPQITQRLPLTLTVHNLRFRYPSSHGAPLYALDDVSFTLSQGKRLAIVGPSGGGKTTLVNLLLRFWEFSEGEIRLCGEDIRHYPQEDVRRLMTVVSQNTYLFNASIRENLLIANPEASQDEIEKATRIAQIHTFIQTLPQGYDTIIGERGLSLSAGERQRLAIARALLKDAPLLLLDEPTANLDTLTEHQVLEAIYALMEFRTTLLITHRLILMEQMDEILVLHRGRIIERGKHAELLEQGGYYRRLWDLQSQVLDVTPP